ncbi:MAG: site-2 protease family protein [Planctomycetota bacterium]|nr:site-2 protease family protein [Planctomycetota bacterium]
MDCSLIAASFSWTSLDSWIGIFWMAMGLGFIIFVHELGHFLAAKSCGVKVEAFYVGFNVPFPKLFGVTVIPQYLLKFTIGETEYGIGNLPLGGYVKMLGQEDTPTKNEEVASAEDEDVSSSTDEGDPESDQTSEAEEDVLTNGQKLDPRDYRAKSVLQRFWIISAGVIMNLVTAPIFALLAYTWGVPEIPARVGTVIPAGPAYRADFRPGDQIVQIGEDDATSAVTFSDFVEANALVGTEKDAVHYVVRDGEKEKIRKSVRAEYGVIKIRYRNIAAVGIGADASPRLAKENSIMIGSGAYEAKPALQNGDLILTVNGDKVVHGSDLKALVAKHAGQPVVLEVARLGDQPDAAVDADTEKLKVTIPVKKKKTLGLIMEFSPIVAVQPNSPAAKAGIVAGDTLLAVNGAPVGDPLTLGFRIRKFALSKKEIEVRLKTGDRTEKTVRLIPRLPFAPGFRDNTPVSVDELGVAIKVGNVVQQVVEGSPAAKSGIQKGDRVLSARFVAAASDQKTEVDQMSMPLENIDFVNQENIWPTVDSLLQRRLPSTELILKLERNSEPLEVSLKWAYSDDICAEQLGLRLSSDEIIKKAGSLGEAVSLGFKRVGKDAGRIFNFLQALTTGKISVTSMGGPLTIGNVAVSFAQENFGKFLAFLAFISVNLAIVNFLPIPVLDGGHAAFLIWEGVTGKPVNENTQFIASLAGFIFLIALMLFVFSLDILTFFF